MNDDTAKVETRIENLIMCDNPIRVKVRFSIEFLCLWKNRVN